MAPGWRDTGRLAPADWARPVAAFRHPFPPVPPTPDAFDAAMSPRYRLPHWDGMILGASQTAGATRLYTEDMGTPRMIDGIELPNPFAQG